MELILFVNKQESDIRIDIIQLSKFRIICGNSE